MYSMSHNSYLREISLLGIYYFVNLQKHLLNILNFRAKNKDIPKQYLHNRIDVCNQFCSQTHRFVHMNILHIP